MRKQIGLAILPIKQLSWMICWVPFHSMTITACLMKFNELYGPKIKSCMQNRLSELLQICASLSFQEFTSKARLTHRVCPINYSFNLFWLHKKERIQYWTIIFFNNFESPCEMFCCLHILSWQGPRVTASWHVRPERHFSRHRHFLKA